MATVQFTLPPAVRSSSLADVRKALRARKIPKLAGCLAFLEDQRRRIQAAVVLNALDPQAFKRAAAGKPDGRCYGGDPIIDACLKTINARAPLDLEAMEMRCEDGMTDELFPASMGYPLGWDEWDEIREDVSMSSPEMGLYIFVTAMRLEEGDMLLAASEHFGWNLGVEDWPVIPDPNFERLYVLLEERGLRPFKHAIDACLYSTGNSYFDYNPWDEETIFDLPPFSVEGVRALEQEWIEAQPIREALTVAAIQFAKDATLARTLYELYLESAADPEHKPQTLAEIWAGDDEAEPYVDPFLGPIGQEA